jgi:hypothetical protein
MNDFALVLAFNRTGIRSAIRFGCSSLVERRLPTPLRVGFFSSPARSKFTPRRKSECLGVFTR